MENGKWRYRVRIVKLIEDCEANQCREFKLDSDVFVDFANLCGFN